MSLADDLQAQLRADWSRERRLNPDPPYLVLPAWLVYREGWEVFCERFEQSHARTGLPIRGFETDAPGGGMARYTLARYNEQSPSPEEDPVP